jgi:hypothetical protein
MFCLYLHIVLLNHVILSCFVCIHVLYYCHLFHIQMSCNSFDLQNVCFICFLFCYIIWIVSFCLVLSVLVYYTTVTSFISDCPMTVLIYKIHILILNLRIRQRWVVNFTHWPFHPQGKRFWYPLNRLFGPHSWTGHFEDKNLLHLPGYKLQLAQPLA